MRRIIPPRDSHFVRLDQIPHPPDHKDLPINSRLLLSPDGQSYAEDAI